MGDADEGAVYFHDETRIEVREGDVAGREAEAILRSVLCPGEAVIAYAEGLVRIVLQLFESCGVLLTDRRLLVAHRVWVNHWDVKTELAVGSCEVVEDRVRIDASRMLVVRGGEASHCLYFSHRWRDQSAAIAAGLSSRVPDSPYRAAEEALAVLHDLSADALAL